MQRTEKYFESDAFRKTAAGIILAAEADAKTGGGRIALDGTVFYPEGGGQPADRGTLTLADGTVLNVTDVHETNGIIWHTVDALPETAQPGAAVTGTIDWEWRFDKMQQHTGEHILSGILHQMFGAENVGFHIGSDAVRMDTSVPISAEGLRCRRADCTGRSGRISGPCTRRTPGGPPRRSGRPWLRAVRRCRPDGSAWPALPAGRVRRRRR